MIQIVALLISLLVVGGYALLIARGRRGRTDYYPLAALGTIAATASLLTLGVVGSPLPTGEVRIYFSVADTSIIAKVVQCLGSSPTTDCPKELTQPAERLVAVVSQSAVSTVRNLVPPGTFDLIRKLEVPESVGGLTVDDGLAEIAAQPAGSAVQRSYLFVTPRVRSATSAKATYRELLHENAGLDSHISFLGARSLGIAPATIVPDIRLDAPAVVSKDGEDYEVKLTISNNTISDVNIEGFQVIGASNTANVFKVNMQAQPLTTDVVTSQVSPRTVPTGETVRISGRFKTAMEGSVTALHIVASNQFGETLAQQTALTKVEKPILGFLRTDTGTSNDFRRFATESGIEAREITLDFESLSNPDGREAVLQEMATELSKWGLIVIAEPLSAARAEHLLEILSHTPAGMTPPSLLFVGAGDSSTLFSDFSDPKMAGWNRFLGPMGIADLSGTRKVYVAVDQSGSLYDFKTDVLAAVSVLYDSDVGFGARNANLLQAFCRFSKTADHSCERSELEEQVKQTDPRSSDWEGSDHLVAMNAFAQGKATDLFAEPGNFRDVTDFVMFWDGSDISGTRGGARARLSGAAANLLPGLSQQGVKLHVATFSLPTTDERIKGFEELSQFSGPESGNAFRDHVVKSVIAHGLVVIPQNTDLLPELARRRLEGLASRNVQVINSLFSPNSLASIQATGTQVPITVHHPSGFNAPLLAIRDALSLPDIAGRPNTLKVGYLGLDLASEFAASKVDTEPQRRIGVTELVYAAVDAMGTKLRASDVSWKVIDGRLTALRSDFMPFQIQTGLEASIRMFTKEGLPSSAALQHAFWDEIGLERMSIDLANAQLDAGEIYLALISFCHSERTAEPGTCNDVSLQIPVIGWYPYFLSSTDLNDFRIQEADAGNSSDDLTISQQLAQVAYAAMAIAVAIGVFLL